MSDRLTASLQRFSMAETCGILRVSRSKLLQRVRDGYIDVERDGRSLFFTVESIDSYRRRLRASAQAKDPDSPEAA